MSPFLWETVKNDSVTWDESRMATGLPEIDAQHKEWISRFNQFNQAVIDHMGEEVFGNALLFFLRYSETHFCFEENLMKLHHCSAEGLNRDEHEQFQKRIQEIIYKTWPMGAIEEDILQLKKELAGWLIHHICTVDVKLRQSR